MRRALAGLALAAWGLAAGAASVPVELRGGSSDDRAFARAALGRMEALPADGAALEALLAAVRATDRFRGVEGRPEQGTLRISLDPWPVLEGWTWEGDPLPRSVRNRLLPDLRKGLRLGTLRLETWRKTAERSIRMGGHPEATLAARRTRDDRHLVLAVALGKPALIRTIRIEGDPVPFSAGHLLAWSGLKPGAALWTAETRAMAVGRIRRKYLKDRRYQAQITPTWTPETGELRLTVSPGPRILLRAEGAGLGWTRLQDLVPLARAERYGPELLDEGERRILRHLRERGYLEARVGHSQEILQGTAEQPEEIRITYHLEAGPRIRLARVRFERNQEIPEAELGAVAKLPRRWFWAGMPFGTPDLLDELETRLKAHYQMKGYVDLGLRRRIEPLGDRHQLIFQVREGEAVHLRSIRLVLPAGAGWGDWNTGETLVRLFSDSVLREPGDGERRYRSDRPGLEDATALLERMEPGKGREGTLFRMVFSRPIPFVKGELAYVLAALRTKARGLGIRKPAEQVGFEDLETGSELWIEVPARPRECFGALAVQGADETRSDAVLRATDLPSGEPLDPARIGLAQARLGNLNAFQRADFASMAEAGISRPAGAWGEGDQVLKLEERPPWVFHSGFGYDKSLGYHVAFGMQRLNFQGMGRSLDLGFRAGDGTIRSPQLREWFPTGDFTRSVDSYTMGYNDPQFPTGWAPAWLAERAQYRVEASYIQEQKTSYLIRRRRVVNDLEWRPRSTIGIQAGHRYERSEARYVDLIDFHSAKYAGFAAWEHVFTGENSLNKATKSPAHAVISAPYVQWGRDTRDSRIDPTQGSMTLVRMELANQVFGTSANTSFVRLDARQQWTWPVGFRAWAGVASLGIRLGVVRPTFHSEAGLTPEQRIGLPLAERYFAGGPGTHRGVEPDCLGPRTSIPRLRRNDEGLYQPVLVNEGRSILYDVIPTGGEALALINLEYRFPIWGQSVWGEVFVDSGQVYARVRDTARGLDGSPPYPPFRTALGIGLIFKVGLPIKLEYGADWRRILGRPRPQADRETQLKSLLISAGFTF